MKPREEMATLGRIGGSAELDLPIEAQFEFGLARLLDGLVDYVQACEAQA